jgi:hypothetical protein
MATAQTLINRALRIIGVIGAGQTPAAEDSADALVALNSLIESQSINGATIFDTPLRSITLVNGQASYTIGTNGTPDLTATRPMEIVGAYVRQNSSDYPVVLIDEATYDSYTTKTTTTSSLPDRLWYDKTVPNGTIYLWPVPSAANTLYIRCQEVFTSFAALSTAVTLPPGYERWLVWALARELGPEYGKPLTSDQEMLYREAEANVKRQNLRTVRGSTAEVAMGGGRYNIYSDSW